MSVLIRVISLCIIAAFLSAVLKKYHPEYSIAVAIGATLIIFGWLSGIFELVFSNIEGIIRDSGVDSFYIETIMKIIGIAYLGEYCAALFYDAGESAMGKKIELAGKLVIFVITIPVIKSLSGIIISFFNGG